EGQPTEIDHQDTAEGELKRDEYDWDGAGKLRRIYSLDTSSTTYSALYDGTGTRVSSTVGAISHSFSYGAGLLADTATGTGAQSATYTPGISQRKAGVDGFFHEDWLGSNRYLTDSTGNTAPSAYRFDAYGNTS